MRKVKSEREAKGMTYGEANDKKKLENIRNVKNEREAKGMKPLQ